MKLQELLEKVHVGDEPTLARRKSVDVDHIFKILRIIQSSGDEGVEFYLGDACHFFTLEDLNADDWEVGSDE